MGVMLANSEVIALEAMADAWSPPPPVDYLAWAENNVVFGKESPFPGPYNRAMFPYFDEVLRALGPEDPCRTVTLAKSAQLGGTVLANIFVGCTMLTDPCLVLYVHPTDDNGRRWSRTKLQPLIRQTPSLRAAIPERSRDGSDSVMFKETADGRGSLQISGANSPASLSMISSPKQVQDDLSKWEMNQAGDPEAQANSRSRAFDFAKIFKISTPMVEPGCRISKAYKAGSREKPFVPCPHCAEMQVLEWENMQGNIDPDHPELACFSCVGCGVDIEEHHRPQMLRALVWRAENESAKREHRSFWIWSAYSPLQSWELLAREYLGSRGDPAGEQTFSNDSVGKAYQAQGDAPPWETLRDRARESRYLRGVVPTGALVLTIGVDVQPDRIEWQLVGWGRDFRRFVVDYGVIPHAITEAPGIEMLDGLLKQTWPNEAGRRLAADVVAIDGNYDTDNVFVWVKGKPQSRVIMVRGRREENVPLIALVKRERDKQGRPVKYAKRFFNVGVATMKMALYRNVKKTDEAERGYVGFPAGFDDDYFEQLTAEKRTAMKPRHGFIEYRWVKDPAQRNEALDTMNYAEAAAIRFGVRGMPDAMWDRLEAERESPPVAAQLDLEDMMEASLTPPAARIPAAVEADLASGGAPALSPVTAPPAARPLAPARRPSARLNG